MAEEALTPDDAHVRRTYISAQGPESRTGPEFDRWLAAHNAEVLRKAAAAIVPPADIATPMRRERYVLEDVRDGLLAEADRIEEERG